MEAGIFHWRKQGENAIIPQTIKLMCEFTVLHTHELGWASNNKEPRSPEGKKFPYGRELPGSAPVAKPAAASDATPDPKVVAAAERLTRRGTE